MTLTTSQKTLIRSLVTTFLATFLTLVPLTSVAEGDFSWVTPAILAALVATIRTVIAAIDPGNVAYGVGATPNSEE